MSTPSEGRISAISPTSSPGVEGAFESKPPLPIELYRNIAHYADTSDLATLCRVSHAFQHAAELTLYHCVYLDHTTNGELLMSWCLAIISAPRRAHRVHLLKFPKYFNLPQHTSAAKVHNMITQAFKAIINLKELGIVGWPKDISPDRISSIHPSTLEDCVFSLSTFMGELTSFTPEEVWRFLFKQPGIEYWVPGDPLLKSISSFPRGMLPHLRKMVLVRPELTRSFDGRPIQSLVLVFQHPIHTRDSGLAAVMPLKSINDTLRELVYICGSLGVDWTMVDIICSIAQHVPNLRSLALSHFGENKVSLENFYAARMPTLYCQVNADDQQKLVDAVSGFQQLDTLVFTFSMTALHEFNSESPDSLNPLEHTEFWSGRSPAQCRKIATMFMASCPSLRRMSFPFTTESGVHPLCYIRPTPQSKVARLDGFYRIDTSSWWMI
jgi:hypothetical protein